MWPTLWTTFPARSDPITIPTQKPADRTNLRRRETLDPAPNAQQRALQRIPHLHEPEPQKESQQSCYRCPLVSLHRSVTRKTHTL